MFTWTFKHNGLTHIYQRTEKQNEHINYIREYQHHWQGFSQELRTWRGGGGGLQTVGGGGGGASNCDGRIESIHRREWKRINWCWKYLSRSWFVGKVARYNPANLLKMNFFMHIFQGFQLDFKLLFIVF